MEPSLKFSPPHFTLFKGDADLDRHLMHYRSVMILYANDDVLMCKIFAMMLQGEAQDWFHTLPSCLIQNFNELSLVCIKEYSSYRLIKKKSDHLFNMKKNPKESLCTYVNRFKAEKEKIVGCDDSIACSAFRNGLLADHQFFRELLMGDNLSLANSYALAENHSFWDEEKRYQKLPEQPHRAVESTQNKASDKLLNIKSKPENKCRDQSPSKGGIAPKTYTRFSTSINQILQDLKD
nr:uncharacterized protein LOC114821356 [Malus domestica]